MENVNFENKKKSEDLPVDPRTINFRLVVKDAGIEEA
jgi:hypothetical protein